MTLCKHSNVPGIQTLKIWVKKECLLTDSKLKLSESLKCSVENTKEKGNTNSYANTSGFLICVITTIFD